MNWDVIGQYIILAINIENGIDTVFFLILLNKNKIFIFLYESNTKKIFFLKIARKRSSLVLFEKSVLKLHRLCSLLTKKNDWLKLKLYMLVVLRKKFVFIKKKYILKINIFVMNFHNFKIFKFLFS